jgi:hypothetical protein
MKRKPEELLKYLAYAIAKMGMVKEATKLAKSNGTGSEAEVLKELKDTIDKSVQACVAKKEVIEKLLNLQKDGKVSDKVGHLITKALMAPDAVFPQYLEKLEKAMACPDDEPEDELKKAGSKKSSPFEWKEEHNKQFGAGKAPYPFPKIADPDKVKGWKHVENHFVDSSGMGRDDEPAMTHEQFHKKLKPGRGYAITDVGQFQVNVGEYEKEDKKKK